MAVLRSLLSRYPLLALAAFVIAGIAALGSIRWSVSPEGMRQRLDAAIAHETGYNLASLHSASFSALPWPNILATNLELVRKDGSGERASVPLFKARISLASWLMGAPRVTALGLRDPVVYLPSADRSADTEALTSTLFNVLRSGSEERLKTIRVHNGSVIVGGEPVLRGLHLAARDVATSDFRVVARGEYQSITFDVTAEFGKNGRAAIRPLNWRLISVLGDVAFDGVLLGPRTLDAEGQLRLRVAPVEVWQQKLGHIPPMIALFGGTALLGDARVVGALVQIQNATMARDEQMLNGSVAFTLASGLPHVSATLDVNRLDVSKLLPAADKLLFDGNGSWSTRTLPTEWLEAGRIDLRLSARKLVIGAQSIDQAAASIHLAPGRLEAMLSDGRLGRGSVKARVVVNRAQGQLDLRASASADRVEADMVLSPLGIDRVKGTAHGNISLESTGGSIAALVAKSDGRAALLARDGEIAGADLERLLARMERGAIVTPLVFEGRTRFQSLSAQINIKNGIGELVDSQLSSALLRVPVTGKLDLGARALDITARLKAADGSEPRGGDFTLRAEGLWTKPSLSPDLRPRGGRS
jgi:AsmA protein